MKDFQGKVVYFPVHNFGYPRNSRIRQFLADSGYEVVAIGRGKRRVVPILGKMLAVVDFVRQSSGATAVVLSEMSLIYAPLTFVVARLRNASHIVDGFVRLYETEIEDKKRFPKHSLPALFYRIADSIALASADMFLTDTDARKNDIVRSPGKIHVLPVGAPDWAQPLQRLKNTDPIHLLYYGNFIPLHGLDIFLEGLSRATSRRTFTVTLLGRGQTFEDTVALVDRLGLEQVVQFAPPVPELELVKYIEQAHVVVGIFGTSEKAKSVIANKVWQGLACDRPVLTRNSDALREIEDAARGLLITTDPGVQAVSDALVTLSENCPVGDRLTADRLEAYVRSRFESFGTALKDQTKLRVQGSRQTRSDVRE